LGDTLYKTFKHNKKDISIRNLTCSLTTNIINMGKKRIEKIEYQPKKKGPFNQWRNMDKVGKLGKQTWQLHFQQEEPKKWGFATGNKNFMCLNHIGVF
jgi:hypothetical protein